MPSSSLIIAGLLLTGYVLYLFYSMKTHKDLFESPTVGEEEGGWSLRKALGILTVVTLCVVWVSEILSGAIEQVVAASDVSEMFVGAVVIAIIGGAAEIASAMRAAGKGRLDLALSITMGASVQIALFVAPVLVFVSYIVSEQPLALLFKGPAVILLFFSVVIVGHLSSDGRSTWFKGAAMVLAYLTLAIGIYLVG